MGSFIGQNKGEGDKDLLSSKKITYELKIFKGLDHDYPDNFNEILLKAIDFISKS
jgi:hypothetical protein